MKTAADYINAINSAETDQEALEAWRSLATLAESDQEMHEVLVAIHREVRSRLVQALLNRPQNPNKGEVT